MSIEILVIVALGGMGSVPGSVVYAIVLILVMQATNNPTMKRFFGSARERLTRKRKERAAL